MQQCGFSYQPGGSAGQSMFKCESDRPDAGHLGAVMINRPPSDKQS